MNAIVRLHRNSGSMEKLLMEVLSPENQGPVKGIDAVWNPRVPQFSVVFKKNRVEKSPQRLPELVDRVTSIHTPW